MNTILNEYNERINQLLITQIFFHALNIDIFTLLEDNHNLSNLANTLDYDDKNMKSILDILVDLDYIVVNEGLYYNSDESAQYLSKVSDDYIGHLLLDKLNLVSLAEISSDSKIKVGNKTQLKNTIDFEEMAKGKEKEIRIFRSGCIKQQITELYDANTNLSLLDLGCGSGLLALDVMRSDLNHKLVLFDQDYVIKVAKSNMKKYKIDSQVQYISGDFTKDQIGNNYDIVLASGILDFAKENLSSLLIKINDSLNDNGYLFVSSLSFNSNKYENAKAKLLWLSTTLKAESNAIIDDLNGIIESNGFVLVKETFDGLHPLNIYRKQD